MHLQLYRCLLQRGKAALAGWAGTMLGALR